ncbi:MAG: dienelactone hydrolase family protein [Alphaproteobacteria bacterium]|nr:dienelactone hydrolase family protein [Alphaproteobacteria bacterium]
MPDTQITSLDGGTFNGYIALPASQQGPGMIVLQEIFGVNAAMRTICDRYAAKGYIAICPDLFWRQQPGVQLTDKSQEEWDKAIALMNGFDIERGVTDILATLGHMRNIKGCSGMVGAVGYCLGGKLACFAASRTDVEAAVSYYGVGIEGMLGEIPDIRRPYMMHMAAKDRFVPADAQAKIARAAERNKNIVIYTYEGVDHAFARPEGQHYDEAAAMQANRRTDEFFAKHLK